jgi:hypothetical protein
VDADEGPAYFAQPDCIPFALADRVFTFRGMLNLIEFVRAGFDRDGFAIPVSPCQFVQPGLKDPFESV